MLFRKKKGMIDVGELARQGKISPIGTKTLESDANRDGFVELGKKEDSASSTSASTMNFFDAPSSVASTPVDSSGLVQRITALSQKISKMEQRMEVIEKKLGIGDSAPPVMW
jgi:hypothetical protein